jgi:hypothetical protein
VSSDVTTRVVISPWWNWHNCLKFEVSEWWMWTGVHSRRAVRLQPQHPLTPNRNCKAEFAGRLDLVIYIGWVSYGTCIYKHIIAFSNNVKLQLWFLRAYVTLRIMTISLVLSFRLNGKSRLFLDGSPWNMIFVLVRKYVEKIPSLIIFSISVIIYRVMFVGGRLFGIPFRFHLLGRIWIRQVFRNVGQQT